MDNFLLENATYQIYPISFKDSNSDGIGDIRGIISKLDYLYSLGIRIIWLSPIYSSPMVDMGYDISDYYSINPKFGTMDDFDELLKECKKRGMRVIMDLVVNHTSSQHRWFKEALRDKNSKYRDYYIFKKGKDDGKLPPNNWTSTFLGSAWQELEDEKGTYYLHLFSKEQPDLNFHNEDVIQEVIKIMNFYLDKGVYGFRCDVISVIYKESFEDGEKNDKFAPVGQEHYVAKEGCHKILKRIRKECIDPHNAVMIGELYGCKIGDIKNFLDGELDTFFSFEHMQINAKRFFKIKVKPSKLKECLIRWQNTYSKNGIYFENHDQLRSINRFVKRGHEKEGSKMLLTLIYSLRGYPFVYQGEEIGSKNYLNSEFHIDDVRDIVTKKVYQLASSYHLPKCLSFKKARKEGRDDPRKPMAFSSEKGHGFTDENTKPWQKFSKNDDVINVEMQLKDKDSTIYYFIKLNELRKEKRVLSYGDIKIYSTSKNTLVYERYTEEEKVLVLINLSSRRQRVEKRILSLIKDKKVLISNVKERKEYLLPYQATIYSL